ncbi:MAG: two-component regulator propeller domain-containing protein [Bacteroidia bacterium]
MKSFFLTFVILLSMLNCGAQNRLGNWLEIKAEQQPGPQPVLDIAQDSLGFMWFATGSGLYRYDGYRFIRFHQNSAKHPVAAYSFSRILPAGSELWCISDNQKIITINIHTLHAELVYLFDTETEGNPLCIAPFGEDEVLASTSANRVFWFGKQSHLPLRNKDFIRDRYVIQSLLTLNKRLFLGTRARGLSTMEADGSFKLLPPEEQFPFPGYSVESIKKLSDSSLVFTSWDNALHFATVHGKVTRHLVFDGLPEISFSGNEGLSCEIINDSIVWIGTKSNGIFRLNINTGKSINVRAKNFLGEHVYCIFRDSRNRVWAGTESGIQLYDPAYDFFRVSKINSSLSEDESIRIQSLEQTENEVYLGTNQGLFSYNTENGNYNHFPFSGKDDPEGIYSMCHLGTDLFLGTARTLYLFDRNSGKIVPGLRKFVPEKDVGSFNPLSLLSSRFSQLISDTSVSPGRIIASIPGYGVFEYYPSSGKHFSAALKSGNKIGAFIQSIIIGENSELVFADRDAGVFIDAFSKKDTINFAEYNSSGDSVNSHKELSRFFYSKNYSDILPKIPGERSKIQFLVPHRNSFYWLGIRNKGLYLVKFSPELEIHRVAPEIENPSAVAEDSFGRLWIAENGILWLYDPGTRILKRFSKAYGLPEGGFTTGFKRTTDGSLMIASQDAWTIFNPSKIWFNNSIVPLRLSHVESIERPEIYSGESQLLEFHESETGITFEFAALEYSDPSTIVYSYMIEGYQNKWVELGNVATIKISKIPPGDYSLRIQANRFSGKLLSDQLIVPIYVKPYWFNTLWFKSLVVLLVLALMYLIYRIRLYQLMRLQNIRDQIARDLHDDIGSTLGAINLYATAAKRSMERAQTEKVSEILNKIGHDARETSGHMSDIIWSVNPDKDETGDLMQRIEKFAGELLEDSGYEINLQIPEELKSTTLDMQKRRNIYLILKECLHNTIKYAGGNKIEISISKKGRKLIIQYSDNGKGFGSGKMESINGNGMLSMNKRAAEMQAEIEIVSAEGEGMKMNLIITL